MLAPDAAGDGSAVSNLTVRIPANANATADTGILADVVNNVRVASDANEAPVRGTDRRSHRDPRRLAAQQRRRTGRRRRTASGSKRPAARWRSR